MAGAGSFHRPPRSFPPALPTDKLAIAPPPTLTQKIGGWSQLLVTICGALGMAAFAFIMPSKTFLIVMGVFVGLMVLSAVVMQVSQRRAGKQSARHKRKLYRQYLDDRAEQLEGFRQRQHELDERLYPEPARFAALAANKRILWERRPGDADFLAFRVGTATVPLAVDLTLELSDDPLVEYEPDLLADAKALRDNYATVAGLSVVESFDQASVVTLTGSRDQTTGLARSLIAQAALFRAPSEMRVMCSFPADSREEWGWLKWLPHVRAGRRAATAETAKPTLMIASNLGNLEQLLEEHVKPRLEQQRRIEASSGDVDDVDVDAPELLLVLDGYDAGGEVAKLTLIREIARHGAELKVRMICLVGPGSAEPPEADLRIVADELSGRDVVERTGAAGHRIEEMTIDRLSADNADRLARQLAPLQLEEGDGAIDLAADVRLSSLLEPPPGDLCAAIGLSESGERLTLDLKQAADGGMGPHGLLVGATGSGKSELLRTLVASLATGHSPEELAFVFVDFKGGAAFAELAALPHAAGLITNLQDDLTLIDRMYAALFGEIERRQQTLREAGNIDDLTSYRALRASRPDLAPLPNLVVIVDEFSELLANRPEFIDLFLTIGRVGRSLGIHLLLSSQRLEEGRLKGLEGHLRYRISLRTYSAAESKQVLGTPDAYLLPPYPGAGYLSVDTDIYQRFKTALVTVSKDSHSPAGNLNYVDNFSGTLGGAQKIPLTPPGESSGPTDLTALVQAAVERNRDIAVHQVWLPPLPAALGLRRVLGDRQHADTAGPLNVVLGLLDLPTEQRQEPFRLDLSGAGGHVAVVGAPQSGKSNLLRTLLTSLLIRSTPDQLHAYVLDFGGGVLASLEQAPHIGLVAGKSDSEKVVTAVHQVHSMLGERELRYRELGLDSISEARQRASELGPELAADVLLVIDNWGGLLAEHEDLTDPLAEIAAAGLHHGIHLIVTAGRWAELRPNIREAFGSRLELRLNDVMDSDFGRRVAELVPTGIPGRGVTPDGKLFQVALGRVDDVESAQGLGSASSRLAAELAEVWDGSAAPPVRVLPEHLPLATVNSVDELPVLGIAEMSLAPVPLDLTGEDQHLLVLGDPGSGRTELLRTVAHLIAAHHPDATVEVVDFRRALSDLTALPVETRILSRPPQVLEMAQQLRELCKQRLTSSEEAISDRHNPWPPVFVLVDDYDLVGGMTENPLAGLADVIFQGRDANIHVVLTRAATGMVRATYDQLLSRLLELGIPAILLSGDPAEGPLVRGQRAQPFPPGRGRLLRRRQAPTVIQCALAGASGNDLIETPVSSTTQGGPR
ncbi:MAG: type VII secretion protein EccCa [Solirubrobacterales bacterium]|nr:type VII secretion protein EccCa [Solirubrobacterales bacterium]